MTALVSLGMFFGGGYALAVSASENLAIQQQETKQIRGVVLDENRVTIPGAFVVLQEDTSVGTLTDIDGNFTMTVPANASIVVSFMGYMNAVVELGGGDFFEIQLIPDTQELSEVVVTALGITRESRSLGYAMQEVDVGSMQENKALSVANMLQGKLAVVQISQSGTGMGGSTRIVLRGINSLSGNNQPLWVIDGIPINDGMTDTVTQWGGADYAGAASSINPEDIESISVLKGANAAALYGSRAQSGAIVITTKKGKYGQPLQLEYNGNVTFTTLYNNIYDFQNTYGQGSGGVWSSSATGSWGPVMNGQLVNHWQTDNYGATGYSQVALEPQPDYIKSFYRTGITYDNSLTASIGSEHLTGRLSFTDSRNQDITPNHDINRQYFDLNTEFRNNWLTLGAKVNYMHERLENIPAQGEYSIMNQLIKMPRGIRLADLENAGLTDDGYMKNWSGASSEYLNPYGMIMSENGNLRVRNRLIGQIRAQIKFTDYLNLTGRVGVDMYHDKRENYTYYPMLSSTTSQYDYWSSTNKEFNADLILNFDKTFNDFSVTANLGASVYNTTYDSLLGEAGLFEIPEYYWMSNGSLRRATQSYSEKEIQSVFGNVSIGYKRMLYLDITGRNDWSSTLPSTNWSYFYPSVSLSAVISEMVELPKVIDFFKLRASWAMVGNDTSPYQLDYVYSTHTSRVNNYLEMTLPDEYPLNDLQPEQTTSWEVGLDYRMFNNRLGLDFTYYNSHTVNQILSINTSSTSGYTSRIVNAGRINSFGYELMLYGTPILSGDWQWDINLNWGLNRTHCIELYDTVSRHTLGEVRIASVVVNEGGRVGDIVATNAYLRDDNGNILIDDSGLPILTTDEVIGNMTPDWTGSLGTTLRWKGLSLYGLFDIRAGGDFISITDAYATAAGTSARTLSGRDGMVVDGIVQSTGLANTTSVTAESYWSRVGGHTGVAEEFLYDGSYVKLRELSLSWTLPYKWLRDTPLRSVRVSVVGRDLFFLYKNAPVNPESAFSRYDYAQAFELGSLPSTRTVGFALNVKF